MELNKQLAIKEKLKAYLTADYFAVVGPSDYLWFERFKTTANSIAAQAPTKAAQQLPLSDDDTVMHALQSLPPYIDFCIYIYHRLSCNDKSSDFLTLQEFCKLRQLNVSALSLNIL